MLAVNATGLPQEAEAPASGPRITLPQIHPAFWLIPIIGIALILRLWGLERDSVWLDEAASVGFAEPPLPALLDEVSRDSNPPLYFVLLHFWLKLGQGDAWLRLPSVILGTMVVPVTALLGRALVGWRTGILASLFVAVSSLQIDYSQEARGYALLTLLTVVSILLLHRAQTSGGVSWLGYAIVTALALYTHHYAWFLLAGEACYVLLIMVLRRKWDWRPCLAMAGAGALYLPWLPVFVDRFMVTSADFWIERPGVWAWWDTLHDLAFYSPPVHDPRLRLLVNGGWWLALSMVGVGLASAWRRPQVLLPALAILVPIAFGLLVSWIVVPIFILRYVSFTVPAFWIVAARGIDVVPAQLVRGGVILVLLTCMLLNLPPLYDPASNWMDLRSAAELVQSNARPGDLVVHESLHTELPFAYYTRDELEQTSWIEDPSDLRDAIEPRARFWYVRGFDSGSDEIAEREARAFLAGSPVLQQYRFWRVHVFLMQGPG